MDDLERLQIHETDESSSVLQPIAEAEPGSTLLGIDWLIAGYGSDVTDDLLAGAGDSDRPGHHGPAEPHAARRQPRVYAREQARVALQRAMADLDAIRTIFARGQEGLYGRQLSYRSWWEDTRSTLLQLFDDPLVADRVVPSPLSFLPATASIDLQFIDVNSSMDRSRIRLGSLLNDLDGFDEVVNVENISNSPTRPKVASTAISPSTPFGNKVALADLVGSAEKTLSWFDAHLDRKALRFLYDEATAPALSTIRVLTCGRGVADATSLDDYRRCRTELADRGVSLEWRTLVDRDEIDDKHDRWLGVDGTWWNVPPFGAVMAGKHGSLLLDPNAPPFEEWWDQAVELTAVKAGF